MSNYYYIDTCSLQWRYLNGKPTSTVDSLLDNEHNAVFTAELAILEWSRTLARACRRGDIDKDTFKRNEIALMTDIYRNKLKILPLIPRAVEKARYLVKYVGVDNRLDLSSGDSLHLISALDVASRLPDRLTFVTSNHPLANIVEKIDIVSQSLDLMYLDPR
jgi:hypothetical protein